MCSARAFDILSHSSQEDDEVKGYMGDEDEKKSWTKRHTSFSKNWQQVLDDFNPVKFNLLPFPPEEADVPDIIIPNGLPQGGEQSPFSLSHT